jgi:SAM-dependent methyltransferase
MDGFPVPKTKQYGGQSYSETRYAIIKWLERELPSVSGSVIDIGAGGWQVPRQLLDHKNVKEYRTFDQKQYGGTKNQVDYYGDIQNMPKDWTNKWDVVLCLEVIECVPDLFKAFSEMHRILKPTGILLLSCPYNYRWFGDGSWNDAKKDKKGVLDYWRPSKQGLELLAKQFSQAKVEGFGGTGEHDRFVHCLRAVK